MQRLAECPDTESEAKRGKPQRPRPPETPRIISLALALVGILLSLGNLCHLVLHRLNLAPGVGESDIGFIESNLYFLRGLCVGRGFHALYGNASLGNLQSG